MFNFLIPKKREIFDYLVEQSAIIEKSAEKFHQIAYDLKKLKKGAIELEQYENEADEFVHKITDTIEKTFILPLDKNDIKELTELLDDIEDHIEQTANRLAIYNLTRANQPLKDFADLILDAVRQITRGVILIKDNRFGTSTYLEILRNLHELENQGDRVHRQVLKDLMGNHSHNLYGKNSISVLKWVEVFHTLEGTLDFCEDVAIIFDRLRIKYR
ncbi:hypothetical protein A2165_02555 [Candidatus Curtissbacteria bacterium RBG_13_40_7]|uniref:Phosphate transport regulator n=1 Tax=Candidatus Curtissbacteria bacterium RBG_13_40_7 TaxID=1797706 RepID=A0A1F5FY93_9BACT|nr:MAG: hypothetical protein A2165_02555 [Candidatus Curtissbacteria bacterium RBG_13_40_7]